MVTWSLSEYLSASRLVSPRTYVCCDVLMEERVLSKRSLNCVNCSESESDEYLVLGR